MTDLLIITILYYLPNGLLVIYGGAALLGLRPANWAVVIAGVVYGALIGPARAMPLPFPSHALMLVVVAILLLRYVLGTTWLTGIGASILTTFIIAVGDTAITLPMIIALKIPLKETLVSPWVTVLGGWLGLLPLLVLALLARYRGFVIFTAPEVRERRGR